MTTKVYIKVEVEIETIQPKINQTHLDSFWYDGQIAEVRGCGRILSVEATGEVRVQFKEGGRMYEGNAARKQAKLLRLADKKLRKLGDNDLFNNNNWFTIHELDEDRNVIQYDIADGSTDYEDAITTAINQLT